jgi:hypothetical protein
MVRVVLGAAVISVAVFAGTLGLLAVLFRAQARRYNRAVATDLLADWTARLELLDPAERQRVTPPANVLAAMTGLPAPGPRGGWDAVPVAAFDRER